MADHPASRSKRRCGASKQERDEADRRYNDALTALDQARCRPPELPPPPAPGLDEHQITALNEAWNILPAPPQASAASQAKLTGFVWRMVGPSCSGS